MSSLQADAGRSGGGIDDPYRVAGARQSLDLKAVLLLVILCASWGLQQVTIKISSQAGSPILQAGIRSLVAAALLWMWAVARREALFERDGTLWWGVAVGLIFSLEFLLIFVGLEYTNASRSVIFFYTMPFFTAIGAQLFIPGEQLRRIQVAGLCCAFAGTLVAFKESFGFPSYRMLIGDAMVTAAALLWAAATVIIKAGPLSRIRHSKTLLYQLAISGILLLPISIAAGEPVLVDVSPLVGICIAYQTVWVAFITYLVWYWLIRCYPASRLAAFTFLTPLFGVIAGAALLDEPLSSLLLGALLLVGAGIYMVNRPGKAAR
ncbi:MAG: DMT family transporter [Desulfobacterales bacterium]